MANNEQPQQLLGQQSVQQAIHAEIAPTNSSLMNWLALIIIPTVGLALSAYSIYVSQQDKNAPHKRPPDQHAPQNNAPTIPTPNMPPQGNIPTIPNIPPQGNIPTIPTPNMPPQGNIPTIPNIPPQGNMPSVPAWVYEPAIFNAVVDYPENMPKKQAKEMAKNAGEEQATRKLMEHVYSLPLDSQMSLENFFMRHPDVERKVRSLIDKAKISQKDTKENLEVIIELPLSKIWDVVAPVYNAEKN